MQLFKSVRVGLLGCGTASSAYLSRLKKFEVLEVYACADLETFRAEAKAEQYRIPNVYTVEEMLRDKKIQLILNLCPTKVHAKVSLSILEAGKHVYSEKPLGINREEGRSILEQAALKQLLVGCGPDTYFGGGLQTCRKIIDDGMIGEPTAAVAFMACPGYEHWHPSPESYYQIGGGPLFDTGPYYLSALVYLLGPMARVSASARMTQIERLITSAKKRGTKIPVEIPTHFSGTIDFANRTIATVIQSFDVEAHHLPHIEIYGTRGALSVPDPTTYGGPVQLKINGAHDWEDIRLSHTKDVGRGVGVGDMAYALTHNRTHRATGGLAYHVLDALLAFEESSQTGQHILIESTCERPTALPEGLAPNELDF